MRIFMLLFLFGAAQLGAQTATLIKDINPGSEDAVRFGNRVMEAYQGKIYFQAKTPEFGSELWVSDGTEEGTMMLIDLFPGESGSSPQQLQVVGDLLLFSAETPGQGEELFRTDGTAEGTFRVKNIYPGSSDGFSSFFNKPRNKFLHDGILYFIGNSSAAGRELWRTDGTASGTFLLKDINPGTNESQPGDFVVYQDNIYFGARNGDGSQLWRTDGTTGGTSQVTMIEPFQFGGPSPRQLTVFKDSLYFNGDAIVEGDLFSSDGTAEGTLRVRDFSTFATGNSNARGLSVDNFNERLWKQWQVVNDFLVFPVVDGDGADLWRMDGSRESIQPIVDFEEAESSFDPSMSSFLNVGGELLYYFDNFPGEEEQGLWQTDATPEGTFPLFSPIEDNFRFSSSSGLYYWQDRLFMSTNATHPDYGFDVLYTTQLWVTDGTSDFSQTYPIIRSDTLLALGNPNNYTELGNALYFFAETPHQGFELYRITGALSSDVSVAQPKCADSSDGEILVRVNGGTAPYQSGETVLTDSTLLLTGLAAGTYPITITDAAGAVFTDTFTLTAPLALDATTITTGERTDPFGQGTADIQVSGGNPPYLYQWPDGMLLNNAFRDDLSAGTYEVTVIDSTDCRLGLEIVVDDLTSLRELTQLGISIFPNPVSNYLIVSARASTKSIRSVDVVDLNGRQISRKEWGNSPVVLQLNSDDLPRAAGPFLLKVTFEDGTAATARLIRQ